MHCHWIDGNLVKCCLLFFFRTSSYINSVCWSHALVNGPTSKRLEPNFAKLSRHVLWHRRSHHVGGLCPPSRIWFAVFSLMSEFRRTHLGMHENISPKSPGNKAQLQLMNHSRAVDLGNLTFSPTSTCVSDCFLNWWYTFVN